MRSNTSNTARAPGQQRGKTVLAALGFAAVALAGAGAQAQMSTNSSSTYNAPSASFYTPGSTYIGFNAGRSAFKNGNGTGVFGSDTKDNAFSLYGGGYFNNNFGLELGYTDFGSAQRAGGTTKAMGISASLVGKLPLSPSFNLLGRVGTTYGRTEVSSAIGSGVTPAKENGFNVSYGLGVEYAFNPNWSAVLQYDEHKLDYAGGERAKIDNTSVGLRYRF